MQNLVGRLLETAAASAKYDDEDNEDSLQDNDDETVGVLKRSLFSRRRDGSSTPNALSLNLCNLESQQYTHH
jgi:hypothetical protein